MELKTKKRKAEPPANRWLAVDETLTTYQRFRCSWKALPEESRHPWLKTLTVGWLALGMLMALLVWIGQAVLDDQVKAAEEDLLQRMAEAVPISFSSAIFFESAGNAVVLIPLTILAAIYAARQERPLAALSILASFFMLGAVVLLGWFLWDRPRPDVIADGVASPGFGGFPSGHTAQGLSVYGFLAYFWIRSSPWWGERILAVLLVLLVVGTSATARLVLGAHLLSDIIAGIIMGSAWLAVLIFTLRKAESNNLVR